MQSLTKSAPLPAQPTPLPCSPSPEIFSFTQEIARTEIPVLILGESGTGKELYARMMHKFSRHADFELRKINCSRVDSERMIREIQEAFREHEQNEFCGTIFLDAVEELDAFGQKTLLGVLSDEEFSAANGNSAHRLISAGSDHLEADVAAGRFRRELFFRLNGATLRLAPLRERKEEIPALMEYFLKKYSDEMHKTVPALDTESLELLQSHDWPGNVRELENLARKMVALGRQQMALTELRTVRQKWPRAGSELPVSPLKRAARAASRERERALILEALNRTKWNRKQAARELQISYKSLLYKIKQIDGPEGKTEE